MDSDSGRDGRKLVIYGRSEPWCLEASYTRAFRKLGWRVELLDSDPVGEDLAWWIRTAAGRRVARSSLLLRRRAARRRNDSLRERILRERPDLLLVFKGSYLMPETVEAVKEAGVPVAVLDPDNPYPGHPAWRPEHLPVMRAADVCFIWSRSLAERLVEDGAGPAFYLPFAWDPEVFPFVDATEAIGPEVLFIGGWDRRRERWLEPVAERFDLEIWGPDYWGSRTRRGSRVRGCWRGRALRGPDAARRVAQARITLNVLREQNLPDGTNMRTFEVPGAGGFLLAERSAGATEAYPEGEAGAYFASVDELLDQIGHYLGRPEARREIAGRAREATEREHRYVHRARVIEAATEPVL